MNLIFFALIVHIVAIKGTPPLDSIADSVFVKIG